MTTETKPDKKEEKPEPPKEEKVQTQHTAVIGGQTISYTVTAGTLVLHEEHMEDDKEVRKPKASIFYVAYTKDDEEVGSRPLTFSFNGGPGSSSVWLHLGVLGPRRVLMDEIGNPLPPPYKLVNNDYSLLDATDLVFIDPVSTGYSRPAPGEKPKQFYEIQKDVEVVGEFIRLYTTRNHRWASPKFLIGESYGTTRAAGLSGYLQERHGMYLNGIMLVSAVLNFQTVDFNHGNDLPYILFLPTYAATAWYHKQLGESWQKRPLSDLLAEVREFAQGEYTLALMKGAALTDTERAHIAAKVAEYTGLTAEYVKRTDLRLNILRFTKELTRRTGRTVGRLDSRFTGLDRDDAGEMFEYDPSYATIQGCYTATLNDYLRRELKFESDLPYEILTEKVWPWDYTRYQNQYVNVAETLRKAINQNPFLKIFVANGYYDLATPYFATEYTFNHLGLNKEMQKNISMGYYEAGHMMYIHIPSLVQLKADLLAFLHQATGTN